MASSHVITSEDDHMTTHVASSNVVTSEDDQKTTHQGAATKADVEPVETASLVVVDKNSFSERVEDQTSLSEEDDQETTHQGAATKPDVEPVETGSFMFVVKNSFMELVEDRSAPRKRSQSAPPEVRGEVQQRLGGGPPPAIASGGTGSNTAATAGTSLLVKNIPKDLSRDALLEKLDDFGLRGTYSFLYLPIHWGLGLNFGYFFIDASSNQHASAIFQLLHDSWQNWGSETPQSRPCEVIWVGGHGVQQHVARYRNSPMMHVLVPDAMKPVLLVSGQRVAFPAPTVHLRPPNKRQMGAPQAGGAAGPLWMRVWSP